MVNHWLISGMLGVILFMGFEAVCGWSWYSYWAWKTNLSKKRAMKDQIMAESAGVEPRSKSQKLRKRTKTEGGVQDDEHAHQHLADSAAESIQSTREEISRFLSIEEMDGKNDFEVNEDEEFEISEKEE